MLLIDVPEDLSSKYHHKDVFGSLTLKKIKESYKTILNESCNLTGEGGNS